MNRSLSGLPANAEPDFRKLPFPSPQIPYSETPKLRTPELRTPKLRPFRLPDPSHSSFLPYTESTRTIQV
jgi:hypothetical protein